MRFLIRVLIIFLVVSAVVTIIRSAFAPSTPRQRPNPGPTGTSGRLVKDPVCGTYVPENTAIRSGNASFCSEECRAKYLNSGSGA
jgi:hypothetical protein